MKVTLVRPRYPSHLVIPPLGLGYLASLLKAHGHEVVLVDALRERLEHLEVVERVCRQGPDLVGVTCMTAYYHEVVHLARLLKQRGQRVIIGGVHPSFLPFRTLADTGADFVVCGEAENALVQLLENGWDGHVPGVYRQGDLSGEPDGIIMAEAVADLDQLPFPDWEQMHPRLYSTSPHGLVAHNLPIGAIITSRGCPYECVFCASPGFHRRHLRSRSPGNVVDEIAFLVKQYGVREIHFEDDNLTFDRARAESIFHQMIERRLDVTWKCPNGIRADRVDEGLLRLMKRSGCYSVSFGIESADAGLLERIRKRESIETMRTAIETANRVGISCNGFFIFGVPGETLETIETTIRFALDSGLTFANFSILDVMPGSELWNVLQGSFTPNWRKNSQKEPEWIPEGLTAQALRDAQSRAFRRFYLRPAVLWRILRTIRPSQFSNLLQRFREYRLGG